jgi:hypothetical protein
MPKIVEPNDKLNEKMDMIIHILQDLFILESVKIGMNKEELRKILGIDKKRIGRISKNVSSGN